MLWQAIRRLPARQRTVLVMRFYADASDDDIAAALGCRRGTVRSLASRALAALRQDQSLSVAEGDCAMTDLDEALRAMLRERATDITAVPADLVDPGELDLLGDG